MTRLAIAAIGLSLAACKPAPPAPPSAPPPAAAPLPALYAHLFEPDATFVYDLTVVQEEPDDRGTPSREERAATATCRVTDVAPEGAGQRAFITCEGESFDGVGGDWYADARGLWRVGDDDPAALALDDAILRAVPVARRDDHADPDAPELDGFVEVAETEHGWCWLSSSTHGDEAWTQICFAGGAIAYVENGTCGFACYERHATLRAP